ncbi:MAG: enoyl-CoA hydratase/isomerase family protein [Phycisphaerae bacterium]|nr:enoyl-CoA hydratase/isomerase family protein [Phycisphaerae bacterium]
MDRLISHEVLDDGALHRITLCDDARRNALSQAMFDDLDAALHAVTAALAHRSAASCVLLAATGRAFSSGFDLGACGADPSMMSTFLRRLSAAIRCLRSLPCPVVAAVQGPALAGGCALVTACDVVLAGPGARFAYPVHRIGLSPAISLPTLRGHTSGGARTVALAPEPLDAVAARALGLVHELVDDPSQLDARALAVSRQLMSKGPRAMASIKRWMNAHDGSCDLAALDATLAASVATGSSDESRAMLAATWASMQKPR